MRAAVILLALALPIPFHAAADDVVPVDARLPSGMLYGSAVWTGSAMYVFGGYDWDAEGTARALTKIARYDPATDTVTTMGAQLPSGRYFTTAVWTGEKAYIFGGNRITAWATDDIIEYDPATDTATLLPVRLPLAMEAAAAVWTGSAAYILGGDSYEGGGHIQRFDPAAMSVERLSTQLPAPYGAYTHAVWAGGAAWVAPAWADEGEREPLLRFDPVTSAITYSQEGVRGDTSAMVSDGARVYMLDAARTWDEVLRFDTDTGHFAIMPGRIDGFGGKLAVWAGDRAIVFAGAGCSPSPFCDGAQQYFPQAEVPEPSISITSVEYGAYVDGDGSMSTWYWVDVLVSGAPIYDPVLYAAPDLAVSSALADLGAPSLEQEGIDWFRVSRYEVGPVRNLLFVVPDAPPLPHSCVRIVGDSGSTEFGAVGSPSVCDLVDPPVPLQIV